MRPWLAFIVTSLAGCAASSSSAPESPARCAVAPATCPPWSAVSLAESKTSSPLPSGTPVLVVAPQRFIFEGRTVATFPLDSILGLDAAAERARGGTIMAPVHEVLREARTRPNAADEIVIAFDAQSLYVTVVQTAYTVARAGFRRQFLATSAGDRLMGLEVAPPLEPGIGTGTTARFFFVVGWDGISITTSRGTIAPGCTALGPGVSIPVIHGPKQNRQDVAALADCAARLLAEGTVPHDAEVAVSVEGASALFRELVSVLDAIRPSFPRVRLELRPAS